MANYSVTLKPVYSRLVSAIPSFIYKWIVENADALSDRFDGKPNYTIAFGRSALLLETLIWHWKPQQDEGWIC